MLLLVDGNGNKRNWTSLEDNKICLGDRVLSSQPDNEQYAAQAIYVDESCASHTRGLIRHCMDGWGTTTLFVAPLVMVGLTALLFAAGTSAIVACIPLQAMCVGLFAGIIYACTTQYGVTKGYLLGYGVPLLSLLVFCITYPLALDGTIPNETPGDWALALTPLFFLSFLVSIGSPCLATIVMCGADEKGLMIIGSCFMFGSSAVFNFCLIALCFKGAGDWDLMPYAAFAGTILGSMVCFGLAQQLSLKGFFDQIDDD